MSDKTVLDRFGVSEEQLDQWEQDAADGVFQGEPRGEVVMGRPRLYDEPLKPITITMPASMIEAIDERTSNRSDFIRKAVAAYL